MCMNGVFISAAHTNMHNTHSLQIIKSMSVYKLEIECLHAVHAVNSIRHTIFCYKIQKMQKLLY